MAESFYPRTALGDLLGLPSEKIYANRLYRGLDAILPGRAALFSHLKTVHFPYITKNSSGRASTFSSTMSLRPISKAGRA